MKVFVYLRVSTKEQLDGGGFDRQHAAAKALCASRGWTISRVFKDQQSGGTEFENRAGLHEILSLAGEKNALGIDTVVVEDATRIARDLMVQEIFLAECRKRGIKIYAADSGNELVMDGGDPGRVMIRQILGAVAQWEKSMIVMRLQAGRRTVKRQTGEPCGGPKPYGQTQAERAVIADIWAMHKKQMSLWKICKQLQETGFPPPAGGPFWSRQTIWNIIRRETDRRQKKDNTDESES